MTVGIHNLGLAVFGDGFLQGFDAKADIQCVGQAPGQHLARRPIHNRDQIEKAAPHGDVSDVTAPNKADWKA